jgi:hypothetical protein
MSEIQNDFYEPYGHFPAKLNIQKVIEQQEQLAGPIPEFTFISADEEVKSNIFRMIASSINADLSPAGIFANHTEDMLRIDDHATIVAAAAESDVEIPIEPRALSRFMVRCFTESEFSI